MITDEDVLEKNDMYILDRIQEFCFKAEATTSVAAAKQLVVLIDRVVRRVPVIAVHRLNLCP